MLFMCFLAGVMGSSGWLIFWAIMGMLLSSRSFLWFIVPLVTTLMGEPKMAVMAIALSWVFLLVRHVEDIHRRAERRKMTAMPMHGDYIDGVSYTRQGREL